MKILKWLIGTIVLAVILGAILTRDLPILMAEDTPHLAFFGRVLYILLLSAVMCLYRIWRGPTGADRIVAIDILGIMIVGLCAMLTIVTRRNWYMDIGIAWTLQSFISTLALSKFLEGRGFDE